MNIKCFIRFDQETFRVGGRQSKTNVNVTIPNKDEAQCTGAYCLQEPPTPTRSLIFREIIYDPVGTEKA